MAHLVLKWFLVAALVAGCNSGEPTLPPDRPDAAMPDIPEPVDEKFAPLQVVTIDLSMAPEDYDALRYQSRTVSTDFVGEDCRAQPFEAPYTYFHGSISFDGETVPDVGIRKKAWLGSQSTVKPAFRINVDEYVDGAELFGTDNITLNNSVQDPGLIRQCLSYALFRAANYPAPRCNFARVSMNGEDLGVYVHVEPIKRAFLRREFGSDDGDLYEGSLSDFTPSWFRTFEAKTDDTDAELAVISDIAAALDAGLSFVAVLDDNFDFDMLLTYLALENIVGHVDGYASYRNNFLLYRRPEDGKFVFVPWGADRTFLPEQANARVFRTSALMHYLLRSPDLRAMLAARIQKLLDEVFVEQEVLASIDAMEAALESHLDTQRQRDSIEGVRAYVRARRSALEGPMPTPAALDPTHCLFERGALSASFDTTWGSLLDDNATPGSVDLALTWRGEEIGYFSATALAGLTPSGRGRLLLSAAQDPAAARTLQPFLEFDVLDAVAGGVLPVGVREQSGPFVDGALLRQNEGEEPVYLGFAHGGEFRLDDFGTASGDRVRGEVNATLFGWEEVLP